MAAGDLLRRLVKLEQSLSSRTSLPPSQLLAAFLDAAKQRAAWRTFEERRAGFRAILAQTAPKAAHAAAIHAAHVRAAREFFDEHPEEDLW